MRFIYTCGRGVSNLHKTKAKHESDGNFRSDWELKAPEHGHGQNDDDGVNHNVERNGQQLLPVKVDTVTPWLRVPFLANRIATRQEDRQEGYSVRGDDGENGIRPAPKLLDGEDARIHPDDGGFDKHSSREPCAARKNYKLEKVRNCFYAARLSPKQAMTNERTLA